MPDLMNIQPEVNRSSLTLSAFNIQPAAIVLQNPIDNGEPQARTAMLGGIKRIENGFNLLRWNSLTIVIENDLDPPVLLIDHIDGYLAFTVYGFRGIEKEIPQNLTEMDRVHFYEYARDQVALDGKIFLDGTVFLEQCQDIDDGFIQTDAFLSTRRWFGEQKKVTYKGR